jgi:hypothetical protein
MIEILVAVLVAALAYYILVPLAGLPVLVGVLAALLILLFPLRGYVR